MRKKVVNRRSKIQRFRDIEQALIEAGEGGLRVAAVASKLGLAKSYAHKLLLEMCDAGLIDRRVEYTDTDHYFVNYVYYQLPLFPASDDRDLLSGNNLESYTDRFEGVYIHEDWQNG